MVTNDEHRWLDRMISWNCRRLFPPCRIVFDVCTALRRWERSLNIVHTWIQASWAFLMAQRFSISSCSMGVKRTVVHWPVLNGLALTLNNQQVSRLKVLIGNIGCLPVSTRLLFDDPIASRSTLSIRWSFASLFPSPPLLDLNQHVKRFEFLFSSFSKLLFEQSCSPDGRWLFSKDTRRSFVHLLSRQNTNRRQVWCYGNASFHLVSCFVYMGFFFLFSSFFTSNNSSISFLLVLLFLSNKIEIAPHSFLLLKVRTLWEWKWINQMFFSSSIQRWAHPSRCQRRQQVDEFLIGTLSVGSELI